jgi:copper(I)-binding protein
VKKLLIPLLVLIAAGTVFTYIYLRPAEPRATVSEARVRLPAAPGLPAAGYFKVELTANQETLRSVTSPAAQRIEIHQTQEENGVTRMSAVSEVGSQSAYELEFKPGGHHLMIFGLSENLRPGATIPLTLTFLKSPAVTVEARLESPGGGGHGGH